MTAHNHHRMAVAALLLLFASAGWSQPKDRFNPGLKLYDPVLDSMLRNGLRAKSAVIAAPYVNLRREAPQIEPMNQERWQICGIFAVVGGQNMEHSIHRVGKPTIVDWLMAKVRESHADSQLLGEILEVAVKHGVVEEVANVFWHEEELARTQKVDRLKKTLTNWHPVVVTWKVSPSEPKTTSKIVTEASDDAHAMVVVGYNDSCFTVMNSRGAEWGESGFCHVPYSFLDYAWDAVSLTMRDRGSFPLPQAGSQTLSCRATLSQLYEGELLPLSPAWDSVRQAFVYRGEGWKTGESRFQLRFNISSGACYYLLNVSDSGARLVDSAMYETAGEWVYPPVEGFYLGEPVEHLVLLCAKSHVQDMGERIKHLGLAKGTISQRLEQVFGNLLALPENVALSSPSPAFRATLSTGAEQLMALLVLTLQIDP